MTEIPSWVVFAAGIFFVVNTVFFIGLTIGLVMLLRAAKDFGPRISALEQNVQGLVTKLHGVAERVDEVAVHLRETVTGVGGKAKSIVGSAELVANSASRQFEKFSPFVVGAVTAIRLIKALREARRSPAEKVQDTAVKKAASSKSRLGSLLRK